MTGEYRQLVQATCLLPVIMHQRSQQSKGDDMQVTDLTRRLHRLTSTGGIFSTTSSATMPAAYVQDTVVNVHLEDAIPTLAW